MKRLVLSFALLGLSPVAAQSIWTEGSVHAPNPLTDYWTWDAGGAIQVGYVAPGVLNVAPGGYVVSSGTTSYVGWNGDGRVSMTGGNWIAQSGVSVGALSSGRVDLAGGFVLSRGDVFVGIQQASGTVTMKGFGSRLEVTDHALYIGANGSIRADQGSRIDATRIFVTSGTLSLSGPDAQAIGRNGIYVTDGGILSASDGAIIQSNLLSLSRPGSRVSLSGPQTEWIVRDTVLVAGTESGPLSLTGGAKLTTNDLNVGSIFNSGSVLLHGFGTSISANLITAGSSLDGSISVLGGASINAIAMHLGVESRGSLVVSDPGSLVVSDSITLGSRGDGQILIQNGALVSAKAVGLSERSAIAVVGGAAGPGALEVGYFASQGTALLDLDGGVIKAAEDSSNFLPSQVTMNIGAYSGTIDTSGFSIDAHGPLTGLGSFDVVGGGTLTLWGQNSFLGTTTVSSGTLALAGSGSLAASSGLLVGGTFDISGITGGGTSIRTLSGTGAVVLGANVLTLTEASGDFQGAISGQGGLVIAGGKQTLSGNSTYSGGTNVTGGALVLGSSSAAGTGPISLANGTTLGFTNGINVANPIELGGAVTFDLATGTAISSGALTGTGSIIFTGEGIISLTGNNSAFNGSTDVGGVLSVNGTLGGTVTVQAGGTLKGNGSVGEVTAETGGTVAPGNSIGTLTATGSVTFAAGSAYAVEINPAGASDRLIVTGTATLNGAAVQVTKAPGSYLPGTQYTILSAGGGIVGTFGGIIQDLPFVALDLSYGANDVVLSVTRSGILFPSVAVTANQRATAGAVEALGQGNAVYNAVVSQTSVAGAQQAFNTLDGEIYPSALSVLQQESLILRRAVLDRARVPASTGTAAPLAYAAGSAAGADVVGMAGSPNAFWAQAFGAWSRIDGNGNAATISGDTAGVIVGYDRTFAGNGADWRLGFAAGYSSSGYQVDDRSSSFSSDNAHVALYGGTSMGALGIRAGAAYSWADISASRTVAFPGFLNALDADTSARTGQVFGEVGYGLSFAKVQVEPFAGLAYMNVDMNGFTELGGPSALTASGTSAGVTYSTLGARLSIPFSLGALPAVFNGTLAWQHAFGDTSPDMLFAFGPGALPFSISGVPIASDAALVEAGLDLTVAPNAALSVFYAGQLSQSDTSNMVKGSFTLKF